MPTGKETKSLGLLALAGLQPYEPKADEEYMGNPSDILDGKVKEIKTQEISAMYSLTVSLCYELKEASDANDKKFDNKVNNFLRFAMDNFETELVVMGIKLALTQYNLPIDPDEVACFDEFHSRYGKYIKAAQNS